MSTALIRQALDLSNPRDLAMCDSCLVRPSQRVFEATSLDGMTWRVTYKIWDRGRNWWEARWQRQSWEQKLVLFHTTRQYEQ